MNKITPKKETQHHGKQNRLRITPRPKEPKY